MGEGTGCILLGKYKLTKKGKIELEKERKKKMVDWEKLCNDCIWCGDDFSSKEHRVTCMFTLERGSNRGICELKRTSI